MNEGLTAFLLVFGASFLLVASIGLVRMPDLFTRMQATSKASSLGAGFMLLAVAVRFHASGIAPRAFATVIFIFLTAPIAAHLIGRAAYVIGVPLSPLTIADELRDQENSNDTES
jgi:multicomponent Na+:H+ antiporter subunit G